MKDRSQSVFSVIQPEMNISMPWNIEPLSGSKKVLAYLAIPFLFIFSFLLPVFILATLRKIYPGKSIYFVSGCIVFVGLLIFSVKSLFDLNRRLELPRFEKFVEGWGGKASVYHLFGFNLRDFIEFSRIRFHEEGMHISGDLAPGWLPLIIIIIVINLFIVTTGLAANYTIFIYELVGLLPVILLYYLLGKKKHSIVVQRENIRKIHTRGPIITIQFVKAPVPQLKKTKFFVPPSFRRTFFTQFDQLFPHTLPEPYRHALHSIHTDNSI